MIIYTSQYNYSGNNRLDITTRSEDPIGRIFSPSWILVKNYKDGKINEQQYSNIYINNMRILYKEFSCIFHNILKKDKLVLVCFCPKNTFCHRLLLKDIFIKLGAKDGGELSY